MTRCDSESRHPTQGLGWSAPTPIRVEILTPRLEIRPYRMGDASDVYQTIVESKSHLTPWMPWVKFHTREEATAKYLAEQILALDAGAAFTGIGVGIFERDGGAFVGGTGIHDARRDTASCETGYWIRHDRVGRGYATEACAHILSWALSEPATGGMGLRRVRIYCSSQNSASARVPEKLGLVAEVRQRDDYYIEGIGPTDRLGWGVMRDEWDTSKHRIIEPTG